MSRNVRSLVFALILALVSASAAQALPPSGAAPGSGLLDRIMSWIGTLLSPDAPDFTSMWEKAGSDMDPNGLPQNNTSSTPTTDAGSDMDPNG
jgi:hypothetical protein